MSPDLVNSLFEVGLSLFLVGNILKTIKDKQAKGIWWPMVAFTTAWGYWNLYYYPSLEQWNSFGGGLAVVTFNTIWLFLLFKYRKN